jgi:hypothetical protein
LHAGDISQAFCQSFAERLGMRWMLQNEGALQVLGTMQTTGQAEMAFEVCAGTSEQF